MDLTPYVEELRHQLLIAAEAGGEESRALAERLVGPLQSAARLALLDALSAAAGEITTDLAPGSVEVRLRNREPEFVVTSPAFDAPVESPVVADPPPAAGPPAAGPAIDGDDAGTARVTLRLPESLKVRIEDAASRDGLSVNSWLVRTLAGTVEGVDRPAPPTHRTSTIGGDRFTGWATS